MKSDYVRCFIIRVDEQQNHWLETHRAKLERRLRRRVSLAEAGRDLIERGARELTRLRRGPQKPAQFAAAEVNAAQLTIGEHLRAKGAA